MRDGAKRHLSRELLAMRIPYPAAHGRGKIKVRRRLSIRALGSRRDKPTVQDRVRDGESQRLARARLAKRGGQDAAVPPDRNRRDRPAAYVARDLVLRAAEDEGGLPTKDMAASLPRATYRTDRQVARALTLQPNRAGTRFGTVRIRSRWFAMPGPVGFCYPFGRVRGGSL